MMGMLAFALLGCGRIGRVHAGAIASHARARLASCFDPDRTASEAVARATGARAAGSAEEVLADPDIRAVLIASATPTHLALLRAAVRAGKAVLCEKPIDLDLARVDQAWPEIALLSPQVMVGFNRRFDPSFRALRERVAAGEIGRLEQLVITSRDPLPPPAEYVAGSGGMFRDMTIHDFDMARYLAGEIAEVFASGANLVGVARDFDAAMIVLRAQSGALVHINNSRRCAYGYDQRIEAFGSAGMLQAANRHETTVEAWTAAGTRRMDRVQDFFITRYAEAYRAEVDHFVGCVETGAAPSPGFADGRAALALANAALESARTGRVVRCG
jgi:myo-inositol 2-dehydrogenase/D-chiro-inositol 1-dehydrogenase